MVVDPTSWRNHFSSPLRTRKGSKKLPVFRIQSNICLIPPLKDTAQAQKVKCWVGRRMEHGLGVLTLLLVENELLERKGPSESLRGGVVSEPGRRRGSCGRETRDRGAWFPLGTPPGLRHRLYPK